MKLELLAPARNADFGREAISHGADAVYIGAPAFGARVAATNTLADIETLVRFAHLYRSRVFATVNTILFEEELEAAVRMIHHLYDAGVDALIVQDMGLLECDLPPIELHASTQCHNATVERVRFLEKVGFKRVILARETSIEQMAAMHRSSPVELEAFVHGALCVSYSGQCYMSQYLNGRSGNRGCCSQPCRSFYDLCTEGGRTLMEKAHLLSLRDFNASLHLQKMIDAGITSFKIEGRLKDLSYLKNTTAHYRLLLDSMMNGHEPASSGKCTFFFKPDVERTFNRGYTDYFLEGRQRMASFATQKSLGKEVGKVLRTNRQAIEIETKEEIVPGDGLCFLSADGSLKGFSVNAVKDGWVVPNVMTDVRVEDRVWRNHDHAFEKLLSGRTAERKIGVRMTLAAKDNALVLCIMDEDGVQTECSLPLSFEEAKNKERAREQNIRQLSKLGDTPFVAASAVDLTEGKWFIPAAMLNGLRRDTLEALIEKRINVYRPKDMQFTRNSCQYPCSEVDYRVNVVNTKAERFYERHGVAVKERGVEQTANYAGKELMTTKYCIRYELGCCLQGKSHHKPLLKISPSESLLLRNNDNLFRLQFDCKNCQMKIFAS